MKTDFQSRVDALFAEHHALISRRNLPAEGGNGVITRYRYPILTARHTPLFWRYDFDERTNPHLLERIGMNATFNAGAIKLDGK